MPAPKQEGPSYTAEKKDGLELVKADEFILVLGNTGVGKSTFIQTLTSQDAGIGETLFSQTAVVSVYRYEKEGVRPIVMLDTPGLDDSERSDAYVLTAISSWLAASFHRGITISGILYLHRISDSRMSGSAFKRLRIYLTLLGREVLSKTILVTTQWPDPSDKEQYRLCLAREKQLQEDSRLLEPLIKDGAKLMRFKGSQQSAHEIVAQIPWPGDKVPLQIQRELVHQKLGLQKTESGRLVAESAQDMIVYYEQRIRDLQKGQKGRKGRKGQDDASVKTEIELHKSTLEITKRELKVLSALWWKSLAKDILGVCRLIVQKD